MGPAPSWKMLAVIQAVAWCFYVVLGVVPFSLRVSARMETPGPPEVSALLSGRRAPEQDHTETQARFRGSSCELHRVPAAPQLLQSTDRMCNSFLATALSGAASPCQMAILTALIAKMNVGFYLGLSQDTVLPTQVFWARVCGAACVGLPAQLGVSLKGETRISCSSCPVLSEAAGQSHLTASNPPVPFPQSSPKDKMFIPTSDRNNWWGSIMAGFSPQSHWVYPWSLYLVTYG